MHTVTLKYGLTKSLSNIEVATDATISSLHTQFSAVLGLPESYEAIVDGDVVSSNYYVQEGDVVVFEKTSCKKA